jgi:RNA polymerase sigma factor (sigma-70 family)
MPSREQLENLFVENVAAMERIVAALCRRYGVARGEIEDVASWIKLRLLENDYAILGKFRGESAITTYLTVVVAMLFRDYRAERWGRWRPSAAARRQGAVAVRLETLVVRDRLPLREAGEILRNGGDTKLSDRQLGDLLARFPVRESLRPVEVGADALPSQAASAGADDHLWTQVAGAERNAIVRELESALDGLAPEDQVILRMRFWEDASVADIARALYLEQKPLYRRIERALGELRERLARAGVSTESLSFLSEYSTPEVL